MADRSAPFESRLVGKLGLDARSTVSSVLVLSLASKQVLYHRNVDNPTSAALASFDAWAASAKLSCGGDEQPREPVLLKVYKQAPEGAKNSYKALYSDGSYLLCADVLTAPPDSDA